MSAFTSILPRPFLIPSGLVGDGVADDGPAINAALATGRSVFLPKPTSSYKATTPIVFSSTIGQILFGENQAVQIAAPAATAKIISTRNRTQRVKSLKISGAGVGEGQSGVYIGPTYNPFWACEDLLIDNCAIGIENKCPDSAPAASGSDGGLILGCALSTCGIGYLAYGNQDSTPVLGTSFSGCATAGIKCEAGGGVNTQGGVFGGNGQAVIVAAASVAAIYGGYIEMDDATDTGPAIEVEANSICDVYSVRFNRGNFTGYDIRTAAGATASLHGFNAGMTSGRLNGTSWIIDKSRVPILVNYNGVWDFRAGAYAPYDALPTAATALAGQTVALVAEDGLTLHYCARTGASTYEWREL